MDVCPRNGTNRMLSRLLTATRFREFANIQPVNGFLPGGANIHRILTETLIHSFFLTELIPVTSNEEISRIGNNAASCKKG